MANYLNPFSGRQFIDASGTPYSGAKLFVYQAGTSTKMAIYKDSAGSSSHTNPIVLNSKGEPADVAGASQPIWQPSTYAAKLVLAPANDTDPPASAISTWDNIGGINNFGDSIVDQRSDTGAVEFTLHEYNENRQINVKTDFDAVADGVADDSAEINAASSAADDLGGVPVIFPYGTYNFTFTKPPYGVSWEFLGPEVNRLQLGGDSSAVRFKRARLYYLDGPHTTSQVQCEHIRTIAKGSDEIGAQYADYGLGITVEKENWSEASGTPVAGEINCLTLFLRNGCTNADPTKTGGAAILANIAQTADSGYVQVLEALNSVYTKGTLAVEKQTNIQILGIDEKDATSYGLILNSVEGVQTAAIRVNATNASKNWATVLDVLKAGVSYFKISDNGRTRWQNSAGTKLVALDLDDTTGDLIVEDGLDNEIARFGQSLFQSKTAVNLQTGTTYEIVSTDLDKRVVCANGAAITVTLPNDLPVGFKCRVLQRDAGQVTFSPEAGATLRNVDTHTKTKGQYALVDIEVLVNSGGTSAVWYLHGSTAA